MHAMSIVLSTERANSMYSEIRTQATKINSNPSYQKNARQATSLGYEKGSVCDGIFGGTFRLRATEIWMAPLLEFGRRHN